MQRININSNSWTTIPTSTDGDTLVQSIEGCTLATGASAPSSANTWGIVTQPYEKIIFPVGVSVYARATGGAAGVVITAEFGS